jgi:uncharacterized Zn finger protein
MPEQYRDKRRMQPFMLSTAVQNRSLVEARCVGCSPTRWYEPADLITLYGDIPAMNLKYLMRCQHCGTEMNVQVTTPTAYERQQIVVRRLEKVWWVRRAKWP